MVDTLRNIGDICRLCLTEEKERLIPARDVFSSLLTIEDVERFTGVQIPTQDNISYVICIDCKNILRKSVVFRNSCLRNDRLYSQLFSALIASARQDCSLQQQPCPQEATAHPNFGETEDSDPLSCNPGDAIGIEMISSKGEWVLTSLPIIADSELAEDSSKSEASDYFDSPDESTKEEAKPPPTSVRTARAGRKKSTSNGTASHPPGVDDASVRNTAPDQHEWQCMPKQLCELCGLMITNYRRHYMSHTKQARYACPHCPVQMTDSSNLLRHIESVHIKKIVKTCEVCGKEFTHRNTYESHIRSKHNMGEKFECKICLKKFNHYSGVKEHAKRVHSLESKYGCTLCSKRFKTSKSLRMHARVHSDDQPYACNQCPKRFKSGYARNTHQLTHSGIVFSCQTCNKSYRYKSLLSMHLKKVHPELNPANDEEYV
ncbi:zinc finger protein 62-like isoform X1 [Anopheles stephensi]|uniref:zinc finger protein 62-like isoform X1 n=1 Tax=Anopheles stephensi TaxID=30069 RepID=UPI0016589F3A|nr:zinc finger protein 62-like isoform X1 [Anopheles stephensi]